MADLKTTKGEIFSLISAARTLLENYPKLSDINSFISISNSTDQLEFIVDLFNSLGSIDDLLNSISDVVINHLGSVELSLKKMLKQMIVENISCNINPSIITDLFDVGINIEVKDFDIFNLMKKSPLSHNGDLFYFDTEQYVGNETNLYQSKDFNVFLWYVINIVNQQIESNTWGTPQRVFTNDIIKVTFYESNSSFPTLTNFINIKVDDSYKPTSSNDVKLNEFNSDLIDSIQLFDKRNVIAELFSRLFGGINISLNKTSEEILLEGEINKILDRISQCGGNEIEIDDSFFTFSNDEYNQLLIETDKKKLGLISYTEIPVMVTSDDIKQALSSFDNEATLNEQKDSFILAINTIVNNVVDQGDNPLTIRDKYNFKISILRNLLKELSSMMTMMVMSPKIYLVLLINLRLLGINVDNYTPLDFIRNNLNLVGNIVTSIKDEIISYILKDIMKLASVLALDYAQSLITNRMKMYNKYIQTLQDFRNSIPL